MSSLTPGPWEAHSMAKTAVHQPELGCWLPQTEADALLMAAAPELLEALEKTIQRFSLFTIDELEDEFGVQTAQRVQAARAAIEKATGGTE